MHPYVTKEINLEYETAGTGTHSVAWVAGTSTQHQSLCLKLVILFFFFLIIGVQLTYNVVLVSGVEQSESVIHKHTFFFGFFSWVGYYRVLSKFPCAIPWVPVTYVFCVQQYINQLFLSQSFCQQFGNRSYQYNPLGLLLPCDNEHSKKVAAHLFLK